MAIVVLDAHDVPATYVNWRDNHPNKNITAGTGNDTNFVMEPTGGAFGGGAMRFDQASTNGGVQYTALGTLATCRAKWWMRADLVGSGADGGTASQFMQFRDSSSAPQTHLYFTSSSSTITLRTGSVAGGTNVATANYNVDDGAWHHYEVQCFADDSGYFKLWIDDVLMINYSGDTKPGSFAIDQFVLASPRTDSSNRVEVAIDDVMVYSDATGTRTGSHRIYSLGPSGNSSVQFTPGATGTNYVNVSQTPTANGSSDRNSSATQGHIDTFDLANLPDLVAGAQIEGIRLVGLYGRTGANSVTFRSFTKTTVPTTTNSSTVSPGTSTLLWRSMFQAVSPDTSALWTQQEINDLKVGYEMTVKESLATGIACELICEVCVSNNPVIPITQNTIKVMT